jgi:hypothetical protein
VLDSGLETTGRLESSGGLALAQGTCPVSREMNLRYHVGMYSINSSDCGCVFLERIPALPQDD